MAAVVAAAGAVGRDEASERRDPEESGPRRGEDTAATIDLLRERIRKLQAAPRRYLATLRTGVAAFDALLPAGGIPMGQAVELCGPAASGRTSLALRAVAAAHRELRLAAWVDGPGELYPPAATALGVDLARLLIVRPRAPNQLVWTAQQLARSGAFTCVVLDLTHTRVRPSLSDGKKLQDAAQRGGGVLVMLTAETPGDGMVRMQVSPAGVDALRVEVLRSRGGGVGATAEVPFEALYAGARGAPVYRYTAPGEGTCAPPLHPDGGGPTDAPFRRVRTSELRNGARGIHGQRPGRDVRMPALGPSLGA